MFLRVLFGQIGTKEKTRNLDDFGFLFVFKLISYRKSIESTLAELGSAACSLQTVLLNVIRKKSLFYQGLRVFFIDLTSNLTLKRTVLKCHIDL